MPPGPECQTVSPCVISLFAYQDFFDCPTILSCGECACTSIFSWNLEVEFRARGAQQVFLVVYHGDCVSSQAVSTQNGVAFSLSRPLRLRSAPLSRRLLSRRIDRFLILSAHSSAPKHSSRPRHFKHLDMASRCVSSGFFIFYLQHHTLSLETRPKLRERESA